MGFVGKLYPTPTVAREGTSHEFSTASMKHEQRISILKAVFSLILRELERSNVR